MMMWSFLFGAAIGAAITGVVGMVWAWYQMEEHQPDPEWGSALGDDE